MTVIARNARNAHQMGGIMTTKTALALAAPLLLNIVALSPAAYAGGTISRCPTDINSEGTWTLTKDLKAEEKPCLMVMVSNVDINLNGHVLIGGFNGINDVTKQKNIFISNGTLRGFLQAINMNAGSTDVRIKNVRVTGSIRAIHVKGDHAVLTDVDASNNREIGIALDGSNNEIYNTTANNNGIFGIEFPRVSSSNNTITDSSANSNGRDGMRFEGNTNTVVNSDAATNGTNGMFFAGGDNTVMDSNANNNGLAKAADGIFIARSGNTLTGNVANNNSKAGISVVCPSTLSGNTANGNPGGGIVTSGSPACDRFGNTPAP